MAHNFLPMGDAKFLAWAKNFDTVLASAPTGTFPLSETQLTQLSTLYGEYNQAYAKAFDPDTRTRPIINLKNVAKKNLVDYVRVLVGILQKAPTTSDAQRLSLKITVAKHRSKVQQPTARPGMEFTGVLGKTVSGRFFDAASTGKKKCAGCLGVKVYAFAGADYPSDPTLWSYVGDFTNGRFEVTFPESTSANAPVFICCAWYNAKGEAGPVCMPQSTFLQGGGVQATTEAVKIAA